MRGEIEVRGKKRDLKKEEGRKKWEEEKFKILDLGKKSLIR